MEEEKGEDIRTVENRYGTQLPYASGKTAIDDPRKSVEVILDAPFYSD